MTHWIFEHQEPDNRAKAADIEQDVLEFRTETFRRCLAMHGNDKSNYVNLSEFWQKLAKKHGTPPLQD